MSKRLYNIEFAVNAKSEITAIRLLSDVFGEETGNRVTLSSLNRHSGLFFINVNFTEDELTDDKYKLLSKSSKDIAIVKDELSSKRAEQLLKICLPIETQLKRLLIYVCTEIIIVLTSKDTKKNRMEICSIINSMSLGDLLTTLQIDLTIKSREQLFANNGLEFISLLNKSEDYDDLKQKLLQYTEPRLVWDAVNSVLQEPVAYGKIGKQLQNLRNLRNKAAHPPQPILKNDLKQGKKCAKHIEKFVSNIRNDYNDSLRKTMSIFRKTVAETLNVFPKEIVNRAMEETVQELRKSLQNIVSKTNLSSALTNTYEQTVIKDFSHNINCWNTAYDKLVSDGLIPKMDNGCLNAKINQNLKEIQDEIRKNMTPSKQNTPLA